MKLLDRFFQAHNIAWLLTILMGTAIAINFFRYSSALFENEARLDFEAQVLPRYALLSTTIEKIDLRLNSLAGFIGASPETTEKSFQRFASQLGGVQKQIEYCWISARPKNTLSTHDRTKSECNFFSPIKTSQVFLEGTPRALLSVPIYGEGTAKGFAIAALPLHALLSTNTSTTGIQEFLVLMDTSRNHIQSYTIDENKIVPVSSTELGPDSKRLTFPIKRIGAFDFVYTAKSLDTGTAWFSYGSQSLSFLVWALFFAMALYIRAILSQRNKVRSEVKIRTEELSQFAYRASHDLKSPLSTVGGLVRFAQQDAKDGNTLELDKNLQKIGAQVKRLETLVSDILLLAMSDVDSGSNELVDLQQLIGLTVSNNAESAKAKGVEIRIEPMNLPRIEASNVRLVQIMDNLVNNAIKYADTIKEEPYISLAGTDRNKHIELRVSDNGIGIEEQDRQTMFGIFKRFHPAHAPGNGLGLSIVQRHIEMLNATIVVESRVGSGTTFIITLPKSTRINT